MTQANNVAIESSQINSSGVLQPAGGGTGVTTSTGSGSVVLSASPTFTGTIVAPTVNAGAATALTLQSAGNTVAVHTTSGLMQIYGSSTNSTFTGSGEIALKNSTDNSYISWHGNTGTRLGYAQGTTSGLAIQSEAGYLSLASNYGEVIRATTTGAIAIAGSTNYGSSGQVLKSNGNAPPSWGAITLPTGTILQVQSTNVTARTVISVSTTPTDFTGLSVNITPSSVNSKIMIFVTITFDSPANQNFAGYVLRGATILAQGTGSSNSSLPNGGSFGIATANDNNYRLWTTSFSYLDSPASTSTQTYKVQTANSVNTQTIYFNSTGANGSQNTTGSSTITVMEVSG